MGKRVPPPFPALRPYLAGGATGLGESKGFVPKGAISTPRTQLSISAVKLSFILGIFPAIIFFDLELETNQVRRFLKASSSKKNCNGTFPCKNPFHIFPAPFLKDPSFTEQEKIKTEKNLPHPSPPLLALGPNFKESP